MFTDSHCHIHLASPPADLLMQQATENNVTQMLCVALNPEDAKTVTKLSDEHDKLYVAAAWHPNDSAGFVPETDEVIDLCASHNKIVAVGETGLDYFRSEQNHDEMEWQRQRFRNHIAAAITLEKPVIIHTRDAMQDTISILKEENAENCGGVLHCFTGSLDEAKALLDIGFYISFSGILTFNSARDLRDVLAYIPRDRLLIETDTPYLAPVPYRGKENQPAYVKHVAEKMAEVLGLTADEIGLKTTENFKRLFLKQ